MSVDGSSVETKDVVAAEKTHIREGSPQYEKLPPPEKALFQLEKLRTHLNLAGGRVTLDNETGNNNGVVRGLLGLGGFDWTLTPSIVSPDGKTSAVSFMIRPPGSNEKKRDVSNEKFEVISEYDEAQRVFKPVRVMYAHNGISTMSSDGSVQPITQCVTKIVGSIQPHG